MVEAGVPLAGAGHYNVRSGLVSPAVLEAWAGGVAGGVLEDLETITIGMNIVVTGPDSLPLIKHWNISNLCTEQRIIFTTPGSTGGSCDGV